MITMHGNFDLIAGIKTADFHQAFDGFCRHLSDVGYVTGWQFAVRTPHAGYDARPPQTKYYVAMHFPSYEIAERCYAYVAADEEPLKTLHRAVNRKVVRETTSFYLCETMMPK